MIFHSNHWRDAQKSKHLCFPFLLGCTIALIAGGITLGAVLAVWLTASPTQTTISGRQLSKLDFDINRVGLIKALTSFSPTTLVCYFSFDSTPYTDSGPLELIGTGINVSLAIGLGRRKNALSLALTPSYFVIQGLAQFNRLVQAYSISLWIKPSSIEGGTILHIATYHDDCVSFQSLVYVRLTSIGQITVQFMDSHRTATLSGPFVSANAWTQVVLTSGTIHGMRLYVNGSLSNQSRSFVYSTSITSNYIYLGSFPWPQCIRGITLLSAQYHGLLDEFRLFSDEMSATDVSLFNWLEKT